MNLSLKQGKQFTSTRRRESFQSMSSSDNELNHLQTLQARYDALMQQYTSLDQRRQNALLETVDRGGPFRNKLIQFTTGQLCYVTGAGIAKYIPSQAVLDSLVDINKTPVGVTVPWDSAYAFPGATIPTNPPLLTGTNITAGQSLGHEGSILYVSQLTQTNPKTTYLGCYNDKQTETSVSIVPVLNSSNAVNGFKSGASSTYLDNNASVGAWAAFDQNPSTFWNSADGYNAATGVYEGANGVEVSNLGRISGEFLQLDLPTSLVANQYLITPSGTNMPSSWYVLGGKDGQWIQLDRQQNQTPSKVYDIAVPGAYTSYLLLVDTLNAATGNATSVQVVEWNLYSNASGDMAASRAMTSTDLGYTTYDKCQEYAMNNAYTYFGMQDVQSDGTAACLVSNDLTRTQIYGDGSMQVTATPLWSSNTTGSGATGCLVSATGRLLLVDASGTMLWQSNAAVADCASGGGYVNPDTVQGSYGGNCVGKPLNIDCGNPNTDGQSYAAEGLTGNLNAMLKSKASTNSQLANWSFSPVTEWVGDDPAPCCSKLVDYSYQCGNGAFKTGQVAGGASIAFDCTAEVANCSFYLTLQSDGNMCLYRGADPASRVSGVWCTMTNKKQKSPNAAWESAKDKFGRNYMKTNEMLGPGEWLGSDDGALKLVLQTDGNLVLYTSESKPGCQQAVDGKTYGGEWVNAVYQLVSTGDRSALGKLAFVDADAVAREYPASMVHFTNEYQLFPNTNSPGNDISSSIVADQTACQTACDANADCAGYAYMGSSQTCWLKNSATYPKADKQTDSQFVFGARQPAVTKCNLGKKPLIQMDTVQYKQYAKGEAMTEDTRCTMPPVFSTQQKTEFDKVKTRLANLGQEIATKMEELYSKDKQIAAKMNMNQQRFQQIMDSYRNTNEKLKSQENNNSDMRRREGMRNMQDLNGMVSDTQLRVLQENYRYILWGLLALGLITVAVSVMKKK